MAKKKRKCTERPERCQNCKHFTTYYNSCSYVLSRGGSYDECVCSTPLGHLCMADKDRPQVCSENGWCELFAKVR